nr:MAG TPA: hypothetical protein [Caudoviricetes sp.]
MDGDRLAVNEDGAIVSALNHRLDSGVSLFALSSGSKLGDGVARNVA